jgi:putative FmdB family regulatory protein
MPIYAYKCSACGFAKDALQKVSDAPLTTCPNCGRETFSKQVTAAGFQLKGSGWYVTDFRGGSGAGANSGIAAEPSADGKADAKPADAKPAESKPAETKAATPAAPAPAPAKTTSPTPSGG